MSCEMLDIAWKQGIRKIIATPHYMPGDRNPEVSAIKEAAEKLQAYAERKSYDMQIYTGNEIYYHDEVPELLEAGRILTLADSSYVLVEFSPMEDYKYIRNNLARLQSEGYSPIIAHVERYANIVKKGTERIQELKEMGSKVYVGALCPGPVDTEFYDVANVEFTLKGITPEYCVEYALKHMIKRQTVIVPTLLMKASTLMGRMAPRKLAIGITSGQQRKKLGK